MSVKVSNLPLFLLFNRLSKGRRKISEALGKGISLSEIEEKVLSENLFNLKDSFEKIKLFFNPYQEIARSQQLDIKFLTYEDPRYPTLLKQTADPPLLLYYQGSLVSQDDYAVAIVGSRHPNYYGTNQAKRFSKELSSGGLTIVSGMAKGIDQVSHQASLEIPYGRTLAVLGCGLDVDYPKGSKKLKEQIIKRGAILSEYALGTKPLAENFPRRNRIISGLSFATIVIQAHERSGSLITAHESIEEGREVFAVPGPVDDLLSKGTHRLIREGAYLTNSPADVLENLQPMLANYRGEEKLQEKESEPDLFANVLPEKRQGEIPSEVSVLSEFEQGVLSILKQEEMTYNQMAEYFDGSDLARLSGTLLELEIKRKVTKTRAGFFSLVKV